MKTGNLSMILILGVSFLTSCTLNDEMYTGTGNGLDGKWEMTSYFGYLPSLPEINPNEIVWTIDFENSQLSIANNVESKYPYILASGIYDIIITDKTLTISDIEYDYTIENKELNISENPELDGPSMRFISTSK